jgi:hypothetical protein
VKTWFRFICLKISLNREVLEIWLLIIGRYNGRKFHQMSDHQLLNILWTQFRVLSTVWTVAVALSAVSDYRLDYRGSIPSRTIEFFLWLPCPDQLLRPTQPPIQWVPEFISRVKRCRDMTLTTHPYLVPRSMSSSNYTASPPWRLHGGSGTALILLLA